MKTLSPGHIYELDTIDAGPDDAGDVLMFVKRVGAGYPGNVGPAHAGTTNQEVARALIDRIVYLQKQDPCDENDENIRLLRRFIWNHERRHARRRGRSMLWNESGGPIWAKETVVVGPAIEEEPTCKKCGHIKCEEHEQT